MFRSGPKKRRGTRFLLGGAGALTGLFAFGAGLGCCTLAAPRHKGPVTGHFDGRAFTNQETAGEHGPGDFFKWVTTRTPGEWRPVEHPRLGVAPPRQVDDGRVRVTFVGHATLLVQMDGVNVLTDPHWSERASPVGFAGPRRMRPPGIRFEDLPPIDAVLVSHNHYDHLDEPTLRRLRDAHAPRLVVPLGNELFVEAKGLGPADGLDWWESVELREGVRVTAVPARHFSSRGVCDRNGALWAGFVLEGPSGTVYFAGDTGWGEHFAQVRERFGPVRVALLPIGAYRPRWFMAPVHIDPAEAVRAHTLLEAGTSVAMHFGTFRLADDGQVEPLEDLATALDAAGISRARFQVLDFGQGRDLP